MEEVKELRKELEDQRNKLAERILSLEKDLKSPLSQDVEEGALDMKNREILYGLYRVEKQNLERIESEIRKLKH